MLWLSRPPYLRWAAAVLLVIGAAALELRPQSTSVHPFAREPLAAGTAVDLDSFEWRSVPIGLLPEVVIDGALAIDLAAGEPLLPSHLSNLAVPAGWWAVEMPIPFGVGIGTKVKVVLLSNEGEPVLTAEGKVVELPPLDALGEHLALVAIPAEHAEPIAAAAVQRRLVILVSESG